VAAATVTAAGISASSSIATTEVSSATEVTAPVPAAKVSGGMGA